MTTEPRAEHVMTTEAQDGVVLVECICGWQVFTSPEGAQAEVDAHLTYRATA